MTTKFVKLSEKEIKEQKRLVEKYRNLINKELSFGDLVNLENVAKYTKAFKLHSQLVNSPYIELPVFA